MKNNQINLLMELIDMLKVKKGVPKSKETSSSVSTYLYTNQRSFHIFYVSRIMKKGNKKTLVSA